LKRLEEAGGTSDVLLHFGDGTTRSLRIRKRPKNERLKLLLASMDFYRHCPSGHIQELAPRKESKFEPILRLFSNAVEIETTDKSLILAFNMCRSAVEDQEETQQKDGNVDHKSADPGSHEARNERI
jgi:hypothetical protein